ncbi:MAG: hypothetical protein KatS3mg068_0720 [Candidatus Sericytochromatia bacterium]|nr:MAG: hypothetical protein KatS3mg068_0720 [Candidatus Sericytochromatia bacterium]
MIFVNIDEYISNINISKSDLLIVDNIYIFNKISTKYGDIKIFDIKDIINKFVYKEKIITELEEKKILIEIISSKYPNTNISFLLKKFLQNKNNPSILNKSDILKQINILYLQHLKDNKLLDYTLRLKEFINYDFNNKFDNVILYGNFYNLNELEWSFIKNYLKNTNKIHILSDIKEKIENILYNNNYYNLQNAIDDYYIGYHPFSKFLLNLIKIDTSSFYDVKKLLEHNFISLKDIKIDDNEEIIFEGEKLEFEEYNQNELTQILNNIHKAGIKDLTNKDDVIKRIENYFYIRKQYAMDNEISEQKYEKDFYETIIGWKKLKQIISKIDYLINDNEVSFENFYKNTLKLINYLGIDNYYKDDKIYKQILQTYYDIVKDIEKEDYFFERITFYSFLKVVLENTKVENYEILNVDKKELLDIHKLNDFYRKNNNYYNWSEYEGYLIDIKNESILDFYTSVTQIEEFSLCPMKYFFNRKLKIRTNLLIENELDSILKGNLLHKILEKFYSNLINSNYLSGNNIDLLSEHCKNVMINVCNEFFEPYNNIIDNLYLEKLKKELLDGFNENKNKKGILYKVLEKDNFRIKQGWIPSEFEKKFVFEINGLNFSGSIDRIDINSNNEFEIIDYKTGNIFLNYKKNEIINGLSYQLPIYAMAYEKESGKIFHSASYFILRENLFLDVDIYPIINKNNYKFLKNKALSNLEKLKTKLLYSKYNYTTENTERICKSCDYKYICRVNPLKSYYITNKIQINRKNIKLLQKNNQNLGIDIINKYLSKLKNNNRILVISNFLYNSTKNNLNSFINEKDFFINFLEINDFYDENKNNYLIDKFIENSIDKLSFKKNKYLELLLQTLERKQIIDFVTNIIKSDNISFYISNSFEDIWKIYVKRYLSYCDYSLSKINDIENKIKNVPLVNEDIKKYCNSVNSTIKQIKELINLFKSDKNNFNLSLNINKKDFPVYSRNISEYISVSFHGEIVNTIYFGEYSLIKILNKFQYFSLEKEYIKAFYKLINEIGKITYEWKNKNNVLLYEDIIKKSEVKTIKNKLLSKYDLIIKDSNENYLNRFIFKNEINKKEDILIIEKKNNEFKISENITMSQDLKANFIIVKNKLDDLIIIPDIIHQLKKENESVCIITDDSRKIKIITELFSKKKIKYICSGHDLLVFQEVLDIINILEFINNNERHIELIGILRSPFFCLNDTEIYKIAHDSDDILISLKNLYPEIYEKIFNWIDLSSHLKLDDLIKFIVEDSNIKKYFDLDINSYIKNKNIEKLIDIASKNNDLTLSEFIELVKNCKYSNNLYSESIDYINIMTFDKAKDYFFDNIIYLDTDELFSKQTDNILLEINNNINYIGIDVLSQNNCVTETFTKAMIKDKYDENLFEKLNYKIKLINKICNTNLVFIMNYKTINSRLFSKFSELNSESINKIFI